MNESIIFEILAIVEEIQEGYVATYGQIAKLAGVPKKSRLVGKIMSLSSYYGDFPCHRVVNHQGRCVPGWLEQKELLKSEKVSFKENGNVDLKKHQWTIK